MRLFKIIKFNGNDEQLIYPSDIKRLFLMNNLTIDEERVRSILFGNVLRKDAINFQDFCNMFVKKGNKMIIKSALAD